MDEMRNFLDANAAVTHKVSIHKISLFEDIFWIVTFKEEEANIVNHKKATVNRLVIELQHRPLTTRSTITISERILKVLSKLEPQDIREHMMHNYPFSKIEIERKNKER